MIEAMKQALEALSDPWSAGPEGVADAITSLRQAIAEAEKQEPVAWLTEERYAQMHTSKWTPQIEQHFDKNGLLISQTIQYSPQGKKLPYPHEPQQRTWVGLTEEEIYSCSETPWTPTGMKCIRAIEAKIKEKNHG